jgi:hypothetical protein
MVAMGELNDNYTFARRMVHEQLLDLIMEDHLIPNLPVTVGTGSYKRPVVPQHGRPADAPAAERRQGRQHQGRPGRRAEHAGLPDAGAAAHGHHHPGAVEQPAGHRGAHPGVHRGTRACRTGKSWPTTSHIAGIPTSQDRVAPAAAAAAPPSRRSSSKPCSSRRSKSRWRRRRPTSSRPRRRRAQDRARPQGPRAGRPLDGAGRAVRPPAWRRK